MIEVAQFLRNEAGRKSPQSGFNIKLIENNEMIGKLFNGDKFPLLLKLNESEVVSKLLSKKFFFDNLIVFFLITKLFFFFKVFFFLITR